MTAGATLPEGIWVDDTSSWITYEPPSAWGVATDPGRGLYDSTYHFSVPSSGQNANASVVFQFPKAGTGFEWYGFKNSHGGLFAVCVDCEGWGDGIGMNWTIVDTLDAAAGADGNSTLLYSATNLANGMHNVSICNYWDQRTDSWGQLTVDSFLIQGSANAVLGVQTTLVGVSSTTVGLPGATSTTLVAGPMESSGVAPASDSSSSTSSLTKSQIAGIVVGSCAALALVALAIFLCMRSRSTRREYPVVPATIPAPRSPTPEGQTAFGLSLFNTTKKDPKEPVPFILPVMSEASQVSGYPYLHSGVPPAGYAHSMNPPTVSEMPSPPQSPVKGEDMRRWPSLSTSSGEGEHAPTANHSVSSFASVISSIRLPKRKRSNPSKSSPSNNIRMQSTPPTSQPPVPRNTKWFIANASPAPRPIPEETPIPPIPRLPEPLLPANPPPSSATRIRPLPAPFSTTEQTFSSTPPTGRGKSFKPTPPRAARPPMGPRPLSSPSGQQRQPST